MLDGVDLFHPFRPRTARCLDELDMLRMSQEIRSKPGWSEKILQPNLVAKWRAEAQQQGLKSLAVDYVIEEIKYIATLKDGCIEPGPVDGSWRADGLIDDTLSKEFKNLVAEGLENVPPEKVDYHPESDDLVIDLVHPSLYCFIEGTSILINEETIDRTVFPAETVRAPDMYSTVIMPSSKYRWMPAEVSFKDDGSVSFNSYINNLHPVRYKRLYNVLGRILERFVPLFSRSLTDIANKNEDRTRIDLSNWPWYEEYDTDNDEKYYESEENRTLLPIPIPTFTAPAAPGLVIDLKSENLQVIVKIANIQLTPQKPKYNGGAWHIEGIEAERIVATGIYYYDVDNITESKLLFRLSIDAPYYNQDDSRGVRSIYGLNDNDPLNQIIGKLTTEQGRCIVFPNTYQHYVSPFELVDKAKPGHRKILVFFLVDPTVKVISTHNVLPQQDDWNDVQQECSAEKRKTMTRKDAEEARKQLMFDRKYARNEFQKEYYERPFSLCEH